MRLLSLLICVALSACAAPRWVNPKNPTADLQADSALCEKDAERVARLDQLMHQSLSSCVGQVCATDAENRRMKVAAEVVLAQKQCMAQRGWQQRG